MRMKFASSAKTTSRILGFLLLGACAFVAGLKGQETVGTLQTNAPVTGGESYFGADTPSAATVVPSNTHFASQSEAFAACVSYAAANGGTVVTTSGTPSMEPLIHGKTFAVVQKRPFESIALRDLVVYMGRPDGSKPTRVKMLHRAVEHDCGGWIMSGDNNRWSESWDRVTPQTYGGVVVALFGYSRPSDNSLTSSRL
jgi:hypothetical protein